MMMRDEEHTLSKRILGFELDLDLLEEIMTVGRKRSQPTQLVRGVATGISR